MFTSTPASIDRFLESQKWLRALPASARQLVLEQAYSIHAAKGETVFASQEEVAGWYGVVHGLVKIESPVGTQQSSFVGLGSGAWFGEGTILKNEARQYNVVALRASELVCVPRAVFETLLRESMAFNRYLIDELNRKLGLAMTIIQSGRTGSARQRLALTLSRLFWNHARTLELTQDELANLAGIARQTANRELKQLAQQGIVRLAMHRITVIDDNALLLIVNEAAQSSTEE
jgi:CRP-like cAMP-binding protein